MRLLQIGLFIGAMVFSAKALPPPESQQPVQTQGLEADCEGEGRWRNECNWCRCNNGKGVCTRRGCPTVIMEQLAGKPECEGVISFKRECNTCTCDNGRVICTTKFCGPMLSPSNIDVSVTHTDVLLGPSDNEPVCTNGSRWREECNWCFCTENGLGVCTLKGCPTEELDEPECEGISRWKKDCNWCNCVEGRGICTKKACSDGPLREAPVVSRQEEECVPGSKWKEQCNWCHCTETRIGVCTKVGCHPDYKPPRDEPQCKDGSRWKKDCNWCDCANGRQICTEKGCGINKPPLPQEPTVTYRQEVECEEGSRWKEECNWCLCTKTGISSCTIEACPPDYEHPVGEPECDDGSRWRKDCNWCDCANGRQICTTKGCDVSGVTSSVCLEGETWQEDCNTCVCRSGIGVCTKKLCLPGELPDGGKELVCTEGARWSEDCNQCRCANGVRLCTKKLCLQPSLPDHCRLPAIRPDAPPCAAFLRQWTYDSASSKCKEIVYGGCGGTENLFASESECLTSCALSTQNPSAGEGISSSQESDVRKALTPSQERCLLASDPGPCFGALQRFYYNKEAGRCERFMYGGCAGNGNKFETAEECQETCGGVAPATGEECDRSQCPWQRWGHYKAKGCLPQYDGGSCCPTSFLCPSSEGTTEGQGKCTYKNKVYDIGAIVDVDHDCSASCRCLEAFVPSGSAEIVCASIECPHLFRPFERGCRPLYRLGDCCPYDQECVDPQGPGLEFRTPTCFWNNETYHEGDRMYFDEYPCQKCICSNNFVDPLGPGCSKLDCGLDFRYTARYEQGCVPIYFEERCCPIDWLCPDDTRIIPVEFSQDVIRDSEVNACILDKDPGSCHNDVTRIYYDAEASECRQFVYGGCQGNDNNFRTFEECQESCSKTPRPSQSECQVGGVVSTGPTEPKNVKVTALLNSGHPGRMSLQVEWSAPICPRGDIKGYHVWVKALTRNEKPHLDKSYASKLTGPLITQLVTDGLYLQQPYAIAVAAENNHGLSNLSPLVVFSLMPNYHRPDQCHLGSLSFEVGKSLELFDCKIDCQCITPPEFTCVQYQSCESVTGIQASKDCPEIKCGAECNPVIDAITGCLTCSCQSQSFTCPDPSCPPLCETTINYQTGCPNCNCQCPLDVSGRPPCPTDCAVRTVIDDITGCQKCECDPDDPGHPFGLHDPVIRDNCPLDPPCPLDCGVHMVMDVATGCIRCECDPNQSGNPFEPYLPPSIGCPEYPDGSAPCPLDCAIRRTVDDKTGCEICECDPNDTGNPFNPFGGPLKLPQQNDDCPKDPDGRAPCPMDCAILRLIDEETGCEVCKCDPNNPGNPFHPFEPPLILPPLNNNCPIGPDGHAHCPMDCAIVRVIDEETGCEVCKCDPNDSGNPFRQWPKPPKPL